MTDWNHAIALLEKHKQELPLASDEAKEEYLSEIRKGTEREKDDHKAATQIAVDAAKTFVQIAIAFIVATVGFAQFSFRSSPSLVRYALLLAGFTAFVSMCFGFIVISRAYKRGDGREASNQVPWSTSSIKSPINLQAITGLLSLVFFLSALLLFNWAASPKQMTIILPDGTTRVVINAEPLTISGQWSNLTITQRGHLNLSLDPGLPNQTNQLRLEPQ
jgi:hypothetical protein